MHSSHNFCELGIEACSAVAPGLSAQFLKWKWKNWLLCVSCFLSYCLSYLLSPCLFSFHPLHFLFSVSLTVFPVLLWCLSLSICLSLTLCLSVSLNLSLSLSRSHPLSQSLSPCLSQCLTFFFSLSTSVVLAYPAPPHPPSSKQQCLPLLFHPFCSCFLIHWQHFQGFFSLVILTVTLLQDKTENRN